MSEALANRRAALARAERQKSRNPDQPEYVELVLGRRRDYAEAKLADYVAAVVAKAPPLTAAQQGRLAALLRGGAI